MNLKIFLSIIFITNISCAMGQQPVIKGQKAAEKETDDLDFCIVQNSPLFKQLCYIIFTEQSKNQKIKKIKQSFKENSNIKLSIRTEAIIIENARTNNNDLAHCLTKWFATKKYQITPALKSSRSGIKQLNDIIDLGNLFSECVC